MLRLHGQTFSFVNFLLLVALQVLSPPSVSSKPAESVEVEETIVKGILYSDPFMNPPSDGELVEDGYYRVGDISYDVGRQAIVNRANLWPGGVVPYVLDSNYTLASRQKIESAMREIEINTGDKTHPCVKFVPRSVEANYVYIHIGAGCSSVIGLSHKGRQQTTLAVPGCMRKAIVMHELIHTLGINHEQERPDRNQFVAINFTNLKAANLHDYALKETSDIDYLGTPYDYSSVMHYAPYDFAIDTRFPVITPVKGHSADVWIGQRDFLSHYDVLRIQRLYRCHEDTTHMVSDVSADKRLLWCDFEHGLCNFTSSVSSPTGAADVHWTTTSTPKQDGPDAGDTNGLDFFAYVSRRIQFDSFAGAPKQVLKSDSPSVDNKLESVLSENIKQSSENIDSISGNETSKSNIVKLLAPSYSVSLTTKTIVARSDTTCIDVRVYQPGPTSYLNIRIHLPQTNRVTTVTLQNRHENHWVSYRETYHYQPGTTFHLEFVAVLDQGSVSLDNIHIHEGTCN